MENAISLIKKIKAGNTSEFEAIIHKMHPALEKYSRLLYKDSKEDIYSELVTALWEAITKMQYFEEEGKCITYLNNAIKLRYLELYKQSKKQHEHELTAPEDLFTNSIGHDNDYVNIEIKEDMSNLLSNYSGIKKDIFYCIIFENMSDVEIAKKYGISRQYVNRIRKKLYSILKEYFMTLYGKTKNPG